MTALGNFASPVDSSAKPQRTLPYLIHVPQHASQQWKKKELSALFATPYLYLVAAEEYLGQVLRKLVNKSDVAPNLAPDKRIPTLGEPLDSPSPA